MNDITKDMMICDILNSNPNLEKVFLAYGLNCMGCPGSNTETLWEAAKGHAIDLEKLLEDLNRANEV